MGWGSVSGGAVVGRWGLVEGVAVIGDWGSANETEQGSPTPRLLAVHALFKIQYPLL